MKELKTAKTIFQDYKHVAQPAIIRSKLTIETLEKGVKNVQS